MVNIYGISKFHAKLFTDAVFGVAITILALELPVTNMANIDILGYRQIEEFLNAFADYISAFFFIGMFWISYHSVFNPIRHTTDLMIWLNLSFLLFITLIPFTTNLTSEYSNLHSNIFAYSVDLLAGMMLFQIWRHAIRKGLIDGKSNDGNDTINSAIVRLTYYRTLTIPIVSVISIIISFYDLFLASLFWLAIIPISILMRFRFRNYDKLYVEEV